VFEIGNSLRAARERQRLGYPEIELATKIRAKYIRALEEEDFDAVPGDAYVRGFLRTYAEYLGLDGDVYVDEYASRFLAEWRDETPQRRERPRVRRRERRLERRAVVLVLAGIVVLTALVFAAWQYGGSSSSLPSLGTQQKQHHRQRTSGHHLVLRGVGRGTYVEVRLSRTGKVLWQGTVGVRETDDIWSSGGSGFNLLVRSPAGLRVTLDGRAVALPAVHNLRVLVTPQRTTRVFG
jgi:helix-turn-helix protein